MTHRSLFKEVAQRIVQSAQSSQSEDSRSPQPTLRPLPARTGGPSVQMAASTFAGGAPLTNRTDTSPAPHR